MRTGWELPNRTDGTVTPDEWARFDALGATITKIRPYHAANPATVAELARRGVAVLVRPNGDGLGWSSTARATELALAVQALRAAGIGDVLITPDSEPNHPDHGSPDAPPADYWTKVAQVVTLLHGRGGIRLPAVFADTIRYVSPPMRPDPAGVPAWYAAAGDLLPAFDLVGIHAYGERDQGLIEWTLRTATRYGLPLFAAEVGDSSGAGEQERAEAVAGYLRLLEAAGVEDACIFILGSDGSWRDFEFSADTIRRVLAPAVAL